KDEFNGTNAVLTKAIVSVSTGSLAEIDPVGGTVAGSIKPRAIDQCFQQERRISIMLTPILRKLAGRTSQNRGRQSLHVNGRQNEKAAVSFPVRFELCLKLPF